MSDDDESSQASIHTLVEGNRWSKFLHFFSKMVVSWDGSDSVFEPYAQGLLSIPGEPRQNCTYISG